MANPNENGGQMIQLDSRRLASFLSSKNHIIEATKKTRARTGANVFLFLKYGERKWSYGRGLSEAEVVQDWRDMVARDGREFFGEPAIILNKVDEIGDIPTGWLTLGSQNPTDEFLMPTQPAPIAMLADGDVPNHNWLSLKNGNSQEN